jgi:hypothetical protein
MPEIWSEPGSRSLWSGDAREVLPCLERRFGCLVTDPPYGEGILAHGDESPESAAQLLREVLVASIPLLKPAAHVVIFWANRTVDLALEAGKASGLEFKRLLAMYTPQGSARPYLGWLARTQPILLFRVPGRPIPPWRADSIAKIRSALKAKGWCASRLAKELGCHARLVTKWIREDDDAWSYPSTVHRGDLLRLLGVDLPPAPDKPEKFRHDLYQVDGGHPDGEHACEKPLSVVCDIISHLEPPVLDPFCGSGTTLLAARRLNVPATGIEIDSEACAQALARLRQRDLFSLAD